MKYSQYAELKEQLIAKGIAVSEFKNDPNVLNEIFYIGALSKWLLSLGIKGIYSSKLEDQASKLKNDIKDTLSKALNTYLQAKKDIQSEIKKLGPDAEIPEQARKQIEKLELKILSLTSDSINRLADLKTKQVNTKIDDASKLKPSHKLALKYLWGKLVVDVEVETTANLINNKIIEGPEMLKQIKDAQNKKEADIIEKGKKVVAKVKDYKKEEAAADEPGESKGVVKSETDPGPDKKMDTADDAIVDKEKDGNAEVIDTKYLSSFTIKSNGSSMSVKASALYDGWRRIFLVTDVQGELAKKLDKTNHVVVFNKEKIKKGEQVRFDVYDYQKGNYIGKFVMNQPNSIVDYAWVPDANSGQRINIPQPPDAIEEVKDLEKDDVGGGAYEKAKTALDNNLANIRALRKKYKGNDVKIKKANSNFKEAMKKFAQEVNTVKDKEVKDKIIDYTESQIKGSAKSLWPDHKPPQTIISDEDEEIK